MTKGLGFRVSGLGFGVQSVGFEVHVVKGLGFQVTGIESRMLIPWLLEICTTQPPYLGKLPYTAAQFLEGSVFLTCL